MADQRSDVQAQARVPSPDMRCMTHMVPPPGGREFGWGEPSRIEVTGDSTPWVKASSLAWQACAKMWVMIGPEHTGERSKSR
jgi:hypothetical protein